MDWTPYLGPTATILVFVIGGWIAVKNANNSRFAHIEAKQAAMNTKLEQMAEDARINRDLSKQIAALMTKVDELAKSVEKHNNVVERMAVMERDQQAMWKRQDDINSRVRELEKE
jgi:SMC interacting uncharacterized protein involved in chromosome segregation